MKILNKIQKELNAPKGQYNDFGNYKYRSCEDILTAVKPLLEDAILLLSDELVLIGERYYIKATATLAHGDKAIEASAYAREEMQKKGMDASQITGSASSYARKYALNGLFCIDDTKDADTNEQRNKIENADDSKEWLNIDDNQTALDGCKEMFAKGMTAKQVVAKMRTKYKVNKKTAEFIETELEKGEL